MQTMRAWALGAAAALLGFAALPAAAQDVRPESVQLYGGTYSTDCGNPAAPKLRIGADAVVLEHGARRKVGRGVMDSYTSFGGAPTSPVPPGYVMEFINDAFTVYVFQDKAGHYIAPGGYGAEGEALIGKANMKRHFRRCATRAAARQRSPG